MCKNYTMRINTHGSKEFRTGLYEQAATVLNEPTKVKAIDQACSHLQQDVQNKRNLLEWAEENLTVDQLREVCAILSTSYVPMAYTGQWDVLNDE